MALGLCLCGLVLAQPPVKQPAPASNTSALSRSAPASPPFRPDSLALLSTKSPVSLFRELLAMNFIERQRFLTNRSPESRRLILAKIREYESMKPDVRELRLRATELRWYLWPLMNTAPTNRVGILERIPAGDRQLVTERLQEWDKLALDVQSNLLANEATIRYFTEVEDGTAQRASISAARTAKLEAGIRQWQSLPEEQRQRMVAHFKQFFVLTPQEKEKSLETLSEPERRQIEKTLHSFGNLTSLQRAQCITSFEKFASLSLEERQQFLKNADRWKLMTPAQRQAWRDLVAQMSSSAPPRLHIRLRHPAPPLATNGG